MVLRVKRTLVANRECDHAGRADMSKSSLHKFILIS